MSLPLLQYALLLPIEAAVNQVLALDPASKVRLRRLEGQSLALHISAPTVQLVIAVYGDKLHLSTQQATPATTTLLGPASALASLLLKRQELSSLQGTQLELRGDLNFARDLQRLLLDLNIDWEFHLGRVLGDIPTQALHDTLAATERYATRTGQRVVEDVQNFIKEESNFIPSAAELEQFYAGVQELGLKLDRVEARVQRLSPRT